MENKGCAAFHDVTGTKDGPSLPKATGDCIHVTELKRTGNLQLRLVVGKVLVIEKCLLCTFYVFWLFVCTQTAFNPPHHEKVVTSQLHRPICV